VSRATLKAPPGTTDTHLHILGPADEYPYVGHREYTPADALPSHATALFDRMGVERAVMIQPSVYGEDNRRMVTAADELGVPTRMIVVVPFEAPDSELGRLHEAGARGVRYILAHKGGLPIEHLEHHASRLKELGWHVQLLLRPQHLTELEPRLARLETDFVIDHVGLIRPSEGGMEQPAFQALLRLIRTGRCWVKLTGGYRISHESPPYPEAVPLARRLVSERPDRLLWGSDWPHVIVEPKPQTTELLDLMLEWVPDEATRTQILVDNPRVLFDF